MPYLELGGYASGDDIDQINAEVLAANGRLKDSCANTGAMYLDVHSILVDSQGMLSRKFASADGYHLNYRGYVELAAIVAAWADALGP